MRRCSYNAQIGQCFQWAYRPGSDDKFLCFYHRRVAQGVFTPMETYGEDMVEDE